MLLPMHLLLLLLLPGVLRQRHVLPVSKLLGVLLVGPKGQIRGKIAKFGSGSKS